MQRLQAFKFELRPNGQQQRQMRSFAGACRFVFNKALALQKTNYEADGKFIGYVAMAKHLTAWRNGTETPWLKEAPVHPLQQTLKDLERAYKNFFAQRAAFPRFKKKGCGESFRYPDAKQFKLDEANGRIFLPKLGWMRLRLSRPVLGKPCNATVSQSGGKWFVSIQTEREVVMPVLVRVPATAGIQAGLERRVSHRRPAAQHQPHLPVLRAHQRRQPQDAGHLPVCGLWPQGSRRCGGGPQHIGAGTPRSNLWRGCQPRKVCKGPACTLGEAGTG